MSLTAAPDAVQVSRKMLWVEFISLGGTAVLDRFLSHLVAQDDDLDGEHEMVVETLMHVLRDEGVGMRVI